jgi:ribosomal protein S18 acetylase RimI-like enzyme
MTTVTVRQAGEADRAELDALFIRLWGATQVIAHDERMDLRTLPTLVAVDGSGEFAGALVWRPDGDAVEVAGVAAVVSGGGVGTALLDAAVALARSGGARRLYLITTNDNTRALRFYQRRGMRIVAVDAGAVDRARVIKPEIPLVGFDGIPLRDELRLEMELV